MKATAILVLVATAGFLITPKIEARPAETVTVKIPFLFIAGNRFMHPGTYKIELLTKGKPGVDEVEVIALRGTDPGSYAAIVTRLTKSEAGSPVLSFSQNGEVPVLSEVHASGRSFAVGSAQTEYAIGQPAPRFDLVNNEAGSPASATRGQE